MMVDAQPSPLPRFRRRLALAAAAAALAALIALCGARTARIDLPAPVERSWLDG
jgi:hypothetical protein